MFGAQLGYLHGPYRSPFQDDIDETTPQEPRQSRGQRIKDDGGSLPTPEVRAQYLVHWLKDLGIADHGFNGPVPVSAQEITAWAKGMGIRLKPWEFRALKQASQAYVGRYHSEDVKPPLGQVDDLSNADVIDQRLSKMLDKLSSPRNRE